MFLMQVTRLRRSLCVGSTLGLALASIVAAAAPSADMAAKGKRLFQESQCATCHSLTAKRESYQVGPALLGVTQRPGRTREWIVRWISDPEALLRSDPQAKKLLAEFNNVPMAPMLRALTLKPDGTPDTEAIRVKAEAIYDFLAANDAAAKGGSAAKPAANGPAPKKPVG